MERTIDRHGEKQTFDERKTYASVYHAARLTEYREQDAEELAADIVDRVNTWLHREPDTVSVRQLRAKILHLLDQEDELVADRYRQSVELV